MATPAPPTTQLLNALDEAACDIGRLRRRINSDEVATWTLDKIANVVEGLVVMLEPTVAEVAAMWAPGDLGAVEEAWRLSEIRRLRLRHRLGLEKTA